MPVLVHRTNVIRAKARVSLEAVVLVAEFVDRVVRGGQIHALDENHQDHPIHVNLHFSSIALFGAWKR